jgi:hypothetical protein
MVHDVDWSEQDTEIGLRPLFTIFLRVTDSLLVGETPGGMVRRLTPIETGSFAGGRLSGRVLSGHDAVAVRADGMARIDARCVLETGVGEAVYMTYQGMRHAPREDGSEGYFRCAFQFETASERLSWLNDLIAVGTGIRKPDGPWYAVHEVV